MIPLDKQIRSALFIINEFSADRKLLEEKVESKRLRRKSWREEDRHLTRNFNKKGAKK